jgi:FHA domain-containing protein
MATWTERVVEGATSLRLAVPGSSWTVLLEAAAAPVASTPTAAVSAPAPAAVPPSPAAIPPSPAAITPTPDAENTWVPSAGAEQVTAGPRAHPVVEEPQADPDSEAYDFLFGDTIYRTQAGASIRIPNPDPQRPGDHDGHTMLATELGKLTAAAAVSDAAPVPIAAPALAPVADAVSEATVLAPIPPHAPSAAEPAHAPSLPLGPTLQLERADGSREALARPVLIGRSPAASGPGSDVRLIAIVDDPDISRTHLRVAVEGDAVVVTDLGSKNGTIITLPGAAPRKLRASEPTVVLPGTLIDLGGGTTFTVRED